LLERLIFLGCFAVAIATGCAGTSKAVDVKWESDSTEAVVADTASKDGASPLDTVVSVSVNAKSALREVVVRLSENAEQLAGITIGTVTPVSPEFDGGTRFWRLGDVSPGKRYGLPIGLWFASAHKEAAPETLSPSVQISSPDLPEPVRTNVLAVELKRE
jgi:hypothetical protein